MQKWLFSELSGFIRANVIEFGKSGCYSGKSACILTKWLYWEKWLVFGQSGFIRAKVVVFEQKGLYSGKGGCIRAKVVVFWQKWF